MTTKAAIHIDGIAETVVTTELPDGSWNAAALGVWTADEAQVLRARTWGDTRTRRNFDRTGHGVIHLLADPERFVRAALGIWERPTATIHDAAAWTPVTVTKRQSGTANDVEWTEWDLQPESWRITERRVPIPNRGFAAVIEMTIAASRLSVPGYDEAELTDRLAYFHAVARRCGGPAVRAACDRVIETVDWDPEAPDR